MGVFVGLREGESVGDREGLFDGESVGDLLGLFEGESVGDRDGESVGDLVGLFDGDKVGLSEGDLLGLFVGLLVGLALGERVRVVQPDLTEYPTSQWMQVSTLKVCSCNSNDVALKATQTASLNTYSPNAQWPSAVLLSHRHSPS